MRKWIFSEVVGDAVFNIADLGGDEFKIVWVDKYGIANIFDEMADFMDYAEGNLNCKRVCVEPYETDREGYDFIDDYLNMDEVN